MKGQSSTILLGIVTALILVVNGLQAGLVLEPTLSARARRRRRCLVRSIMNR